MEKPLRATKHCRHYSYDRGKSFTDGKGPQCALGIDISAPGAGRQCWPDPELDCHRREDYTEAERAAWRAWTDHRLSMVGDALAVFGGPVACGAETRKPCPHCDGEVVLQRMSNGHAWLACTTEGCIDPVHFNVDRSAAWPAASAMST